ncbi:proline-rich protein 36 isoform X3 [Oncorhynchus kisutch]|uniref:proline-rich protein 36 isoform X3 n=1 Tax=Oncorhynchus kisutch TaxID=8019 RepID=UPI0012DED6E4|nr:proline-rich protein 36 isoform X3 [Oncorhynchus kisutch]
MQGDNWTFILGLKKRTRKAFGIRKKEKGDKDNDSTGSPDRDGGSQKKANGAAVNGFSGEIDWDRYNTPTVDDEGYSLRPDEEEGPGSAGPKPPKEHFFSSSESEGEEDHRKKFKIKIKPLPAESANCLAPSVDELKASIGNIALSPSPLRSSPRRSPGLMNKDCSEEIQVARPRRSAPIAAPTLAAPVLQAPRSKKSPAVPLPEKEPAPVPVPAPVPAPAPVPVPAPVPAPVQAPVPVPEDATALFGPPLETAFREQKTEVGISEQVVCDVWGAPLPESESLSPDFCFTRTFSTGTPPPLPPKNVPTSPPPTSSPSADAAELPVSIEGSGRKTSIPNLDNIFGPAEPSAFGEESADKWVCFSEELAASERPPPPKDPAPPLPTSPAPPEDPSAPPVPTSPLPSEDSSPSLPPSAHPPLSHRKTLLPLSPLCLPPHSHRKTLLPLSPLCLPPLSHRKNRSLLYSPLHPLQRNQHSAYPQSHPCLKTLHPHPHHFHQRAIHHPPLLHPPLFPLLNHPPALTLFSLSLHPPVLPLFSLSLHPPVLPMFSLSLHPPVLPLFSLSIHPPALPLFSLSLHPPALPLFSLSLHPPVLPLFSLSLPPPALPLSLLWFPLLPKQEHLSPPPAPLALPLWTSPHAPSPHPLSLSRRNRRVLKGQLSLSHLPHRTRTLLKPPPLPKMLARCPVLRLPLRHPLRTGQLCPCQDPRQGAWVVEHPLQLVLLHRQLHQRFSAALPLPLHAPPHDPNCPLGNPARGT